MDTQSQPADLTLQLPRDVYHVVVYTLRGLLPPPETDTPEAEARRDRAAIARVASMLPANGEEADLASRCVAHAAYAMDCLRLARGYRATDHAYFLKCTAQAASTERKAQSARSLLLRLQTERRKRQADNAAADQDAWTEHCAIGMMANALGDASPKARPEPSPPRIREPFLSARIDALVSSLAMGSIQLGHRSGHIFLRSAVAHYRPQWSGNQAGFSQNLSYIKGL